MLIFKVQNTFHAVNGFPFLDRCYTKHEKTYMTVGPDVKFAFVNSKQACRKACVKVASCLAASYEVGLIWKSKMVFSVSVSVLLYINVAIDYDCFF